MNDEVRKKSKERVVQMTWKGNVLGDVGYSKRMGGEGKKEIRERKKAI